ncbi:IS5/IS1182 family transposase, partial [Massilia sp. CCM 8693]|nr:IS5/IS1182 family transposase [Massilia aquatica]
AADSGQLATVLAAVKRNVGDDAELVLADAGYRSEAMLEQLRDHPSELIVALGRIGKQEVVIDPKKRPL